MATVLVCDDSALVRETLHRVLVTVPGVTRVVDAASGEEALARWPVERPSLVLMDVRMPGIGGVEATRRLLSRHPDAVVVMVTMAEDVDGVARAVMGGARGYVVKDADSGGDGRGHGACPDRRLWRRSAPAPPGRRGVDPPRRPDRA